MCCSHHPFQLNIWLIKRPSNFKTDKISCVFFGLIVSVVVKEGGGGGGRRVNASSLEPLDYYGVTSLTKGNFSFSEPYNFSFNIFKSCAVFPSFVLLSIGI